MSPRGNPPGRGRPPLPPGEARTVDVRVRLTTTEAARIDAARGATPRSAWLRAVALAATEDDHGT